MGRGSFEGCLSGGGRSCQDNQSKIPSFELPHEKTIASGTRPLAVKGKPHRLKEKTPQFEEKSSFRLKCLAAPSKKVLDINQKETTRLSYPAWVGCMTMILLQ